LREKKFSYCLRVRFSEIDGQRVVFNAHYMTYVEVVLNEYLREVIGPYHAMMLDSNHDFEIVLVKSEMEFMSPARLDDVLQISCGLIRLGNSSFSMEYEIRRENEEPLLAIARKTYVSINLKKGKSCPIPPEIRQRFIDYEEWSD